MMAAPQSLIPDGFRQETNVLFAQCASSTLSNSSKDSLCLHLHCLLRGLEEAVQTLEGTPFTNDVAVLRQLHSRGRQFYNYFLSSVNTCSIPSSVIDNVRTERSSGAGRPRLVVNVEQIELLRGTRFTWEEIARIVGISRTTIWRRFRDLGISLEKYSDISDQDLDCVVREVYGNNPNIGASILQGYLGSKGITVQRIRLRESVARVNPTRALTRWQQVISRRSYSVPGPNALWHIDGNHSLIRWRFVVHGSVDGFSRMITYLEASTNNKAETVYQHFIKATTEFGVPSRVRSDKGGENIEVCHYMISYRGPGRGSHIAGSSVHNQRIERMWRDVYRCVCCSFHEVFLYLESQGVLDPASDSDLFVLHCVFLSVVNSHLKAFVHAWNHHPLRTERNHKIWINGMIDPNRRSQIAVQDVVNGVTEYGIDYYGPISDEQIHTVNVPETLCPLPTYVLDHFVNNLQAVSTFDEGMAEYIDAKHLLNQLLSTVQSQEESSSDSDH